MSITAAQVMELREATGLGMMTCKKALIETNGNLEMAIENLRKQGQVTAAKRAGKTAEEGKVTILIKDSNALIYEVNSETDFVARNEDFLTFTADIGELLISQKPGSMDEAALLKFPQHNNQTIAEKTMEIMGKIGEKISFRRFQLHSLNTEKEQAFSYIHGNGKIGVLIILQPEDSAILNSQLLQELGKDLAMQVAAAKPLAITRDKVPEEIAAKEKEIYLAQVQASGKPEKIWDKIVDGKLNKYFQQIVLLEQQFIKDTDINVTGRINQVEKESNTKITITSFVRYQLGIE